MKTTLAILSAILIVQISAQPAPTPIFNSSQWTGTWVIGYTENLGNYELTFCSQVNISNPTNVSQYGTINLSQRAFFAPQSLGFDKWGWWEQTTTLYYNVYTPQYAYLDPEMTLAYYVVTDFGDDYLSVVTPSGPGGMSYIYFMYMKNDCKSGACKAAEQNIGCLSNIPTQANFDPNPLVGIWYVTGIYSSSDHWPGATCAQFQFDVVSTTPPFYGVKIQYNSTSGSHQVYATTAAINTENPGMIFQEGVPPIFVNYFDGSTTAIVISGREDIAYFLSNSPTAMTQAQIDLFEKQIDEANIENCESCSVISFTGCS